MQLDWRFAAQTDSPTNKRKHMESTSVSGTVLWPEQKEKILTPLPGGVLSVGLLHFLL
jgi:hypothetical protein